MQQHSARDDAVHLLPLGKSQSYYIYTVFFSPEVVFVNGACETVLHKDNSFQSVQKESIKDCCPDTFELLDIYDHI